LNREKYLAGKKRWRDKNKDKISAYNKQYREAHGYSLKARRSENKRIALVYGYFDNDICAYVGRGSMARVLQHKYTSLWWRPDLLLVTMTCKDEWEAMEYEGKWGGRYRPKHNKDGYRYN
jgi:hypothetical protein